MNFGTSGTGGRIEKAGRIGRAGTSGTGETSESASQSQRMHGAGYVGAIVGLVRQVGVFFCFCGLSFVICNYFVSLSLYKQKTLSL